MSDDLINRMSELESFLRGQAPLRGAWFGENNPALYKGAFWWRHYLAPMAEAAAALTEAQATIARLEARLADVASAAARLDDTRMDQMRRLCDFAVAFAAEVADTYPAAAKSFCEGLAALSPGKGE